MYHVLGQDGREYGPVSADQLRVWAAEHRVHSQTPARIEAETTWRPLGSLAEVWPAAPPQFQRALPPGMVSSYLPFAVLVTLCCCQPFGIIAIVYGAQVGARLAAGDLAGAQSASSTAQRWCWLGLVFGLLGCLMGGALGFVSELSHH